MSTLHLNGFELKLSSPTFSLYQKQFPDNKLLRDFRKQNEDWFTHWREGTIYAIPIVERPKTDLGKPTTANWRDHLNLLAARIDRVLPNKFPKYEAFLHRPFSFLSRKDELVTTIFPRLHQAPTALSKNVTLRECCCR